jgi:HTH-type transcriptional regulator/antitoxin HigA
VSKMDNCAIFEPDWVSPPGETIKNVLETRDIPIDEFFEVLGVEESNGHQLLSGLIAINKAIALKIESVTDIPAQFWLKRETTYRKQKESFQNESISWLKRLPLADMVKLDWIPRGLSQHDKIQACFDFFGVNSLDEWEEIYTSKLSIVSFRTSNSFDTVPESVVTWLRQAEIIAEKVKTSKWNREKLIDSLSEIRALSRIKEPVTFIPKLEALLNSCGVVLVIVPTPKGTRASGATYFLDSEKALLIMSFRYKTDDHFWFSLFHEIGHLILHGDKSLFIEDSSIENSTHEKEADDFSEKVLIPAEFEQQLSEFSHQDWRGIIRFARQIGISVGIVVGQLQHREQIPHAYLNKLKVKYKA